MTTSYFEDIEKHIRSRINSSQSSIFVAVAWFTNQLLFDSLTEALKRNVTVKILILNDLLNRSEFGLDFGVLVEHGADVRFAGSGKGTMHNKFCIVDNMVLSGSYNWTYHANKNDENIIVTDDENVVNSYIDQFDKLFSDGSPLNIPYKHLKWTDVKEGDFSELRRNIFRDVIAQNDVNRELKQIKLINLDHAYKSGDVNELDKASSLPVREQFRTIMDVLISRSRDFTFMLWEENEINVPFGKNVDGYGHIGEWYFIPISIKKDNSYREYIEGLLKTKLGKKCRYMPGYKLGIYDIEYIAAIKKILGNESLSQISAKLIPDNMLRIDKAKMFFYQFSTPMFNQSQPRTKKNGAPRTISAINLFGIVREEDGDNAVFYQGWDPQKRGEEIAKKFFEKGL
jgi:hypothetical protein